MPLLHPGGSCGGETGGGLDLRTTLRTKYLHIGKRLRVGASVGTRFIFGISFSRQRQLPTYAFHVCIGPFTFRAEWWNFRFVHNWRWHDDA